MDLRASDGPLFVLMIHPGWAQARDDDRVRAAVVGFAAEIRELARRRGSLHRYVFANYGDVEDEVIAGYGEASVSKLWAASRKYDPEGIFQKGVPGGYKLPVQPS